MLNPIKYNRQRYNITQQQLAWASDIQRLTVLRTEQGLYEEIPGAVLAGLNKLVPNLDMRLVHDDYIRFQVWQRQQNAGKLRFNAVDKEESYAGQPGLKLVALRAVSNMSQIGLCIGLCVNAGLIHKWEAGKQYHAPAQLLDALRDAGYSESDIAWLGME